MSRTLFRRTSWDKPAATGRGHHSEIPPRLSILLRTRGLFAQGGVSPRGPFLTPQPPSPDTAGFQLHQSIPTNAEYDREGPSFCQPSDPIGSFKLTSSEPLCFGLFYIGLCAAFHMHKWFSPSLLWSSRAGLLSGPRSRQTRTRFRASAQGVLFSLPRNLSPIFYCGLLPVHQFSACLTFSERPLLIFPGLSKLCSHIFLVFLFLGTYHNLLMIFFCLFILLLVYYPSSPIAYQFHGSRCFVPLGHHWVARTKCSINVSRLDGWPGDRWMPEWMNVGG